MEAEYIKVFKELRSAIDSQPMNGEDVGEFIIKLADFYPEYNLKMVEALHLANNAAKDCEEQVDSNGKAISSAKAKVLADATTESHQYEIARAHVQNLDQLISAAKAFQKGFINEYQRV